MSGGYGFLSHLKERVSAETLMNDEIKKKRKQILQRSNEILKLKMRIADDLVTLAIKEKDMLNMQLSLDEMRNK